MLERLTDPLNQRLRNRILFASLGATAAGLTEGYAAAFSGMKEWSWPGMMLTAVGIAGVALDAVVEGEKIYRRDAVYTAAVHADPNLGTLAHHLQEELWLHNWAAGAMTQYAELPLPAPDRVTSLPGYDQAA